MLLLDLRVAKHFVEFIAQGTKGKIDDEPPIRGMWFKWRIALSMNESRVAYSQACSRIRDAVPYRHVAKIYARESSIPFRGI
jgi:hypothetical protein